MKKIKITYTGKICTELDQVIEEYFRAREYTLDGSGYNLAKDIRDITYYKT